MLHWAVTLPICGSLWTLLYFLLCRLNPARSYEWHIRTVTLIHALVITTLSSLSIFIQGPWPFTEAGGPSTWTQNFVITICLGYFFLDFTWCLYFKTEGMVMLFHHTLSIAGMSSCLITGLWGTEMLATIMGAEITNPLLQCRWFLRETGHYDGILGDLVDWAFIGLFTLFRIVIGSYLLYTYYQQDTDYLGRLGGTLIYMVGWVFWINILQYGIRKHKKRRMKKLKEQKEKLAENKSTLNGNGNIDKTQSTSVGENTVGGVEQNGNILHKLSSSENVIIKRHLEKTVKNGDFTVDK